MKNINNNPSKTETPIIETTPNTEENNTGRRIFLDGTLGGGGHSLALLERLSNSTNSNNDIVFGCDIDPDALTTSSERLQQYMNQTDTDNPLFIPVLSNFCNLLDVIC